MARPGIYLPALAGYVRRFAFVPSYGDGEPLSLLTADGLRLAAARLEGPPAAFATVVLVHGLGHWSRTPRIHAFARLLAHQVHVVVPDLRGHGASEGLSTLGLDEPADVAAAVAAARSAPGAAGLGVVTVGISLGGAACLLHAGTHGGVEGVVAISSPAWSGAWDTPSTDRIRRVVGSPLGRAVIARAMRTRVAATCAAVPDARDVVAGIAPAFTLIVHDRADHYFGPEHPQTLFDWARDPKDLWWVEGAGHGTDLLTPALASRLLGELRRRLG